MKKMSETIVFFGSGPVAEASLEHLVKYFDVEAVITKPATRNEMSVVVGSSEDIKVLTASDRRELDNIIQSEKFTSELGVIVDFGVILSKEVIEYFDFGIVNSHFSLLPRWRGADPISFSILNGDSKTGVSLMLIEPDLDTGKILVQKSLPIKPDDTTDSLTHRLIGLSNSLLEKYLPMYVNGEIKPRKQPHPARATYSRRLTKQDGAIDWSKPATEIERQIRAFSGWPKSTTALANIDVIITSASAIDVPGKSGDFTSLNKRLIVFCGHGALEIKTLKPAGKKEMSGAAFINGYLK